MIIIGLGTNNHDDSICAYINGEIRYAKYEREVNIKIEQAPDWWFFEKIKNWKINHRDVDLFVKTERGFFYGHVWRLPLHGSEFLYTNDIQKTFILDHHLAHLYSCQSYIRGTTQGVAMDAMGSGGHRILLDDTKKLHRFTSITPGNIYQSIATAMGLSSSQYYQNNAGKVMGLMSYGKIDKGLYHLLKDKSLNYIFETGLIYHNFHGKLDQRWFNFIKTIDEICFEFILKLFKKLDKSKPIVYSGGVALNVEWNRRLKDNGYNLIIEPMVDDSGLSLGCMRYGLFKKNKNLNYTFKNFPYVEEDEKPETEPTDETINKVAKLLSQGKIVGWYQGNGELGPRALGNRSILMDPRILNGKDFLNEKVKHREWWRPYGASVVEENAYKYFDIPYSPYMLFTSKVLVNNLHAITHVDGTCRHQTVNIKQNKSYYKLLKAFEKETGLPILLNTSLNEGGKPICSKIEQAKKILKDTELDYLCVGNTIL